MQKGNIKGQKNHKNVMWIVATIFENGMSFIQQKHYVYIGFEPIRGICPKL